VPENVTADAIVDRFKEFGDVIGVEKLTGSKRMIGKYFVIFGDASSCIRALAAASETPLQVMGSVVDVQLRGVRAEASNFPVSPPVENGDTVFVTCSCDIYVAAGAIAERCGRIPVEKAPVGHHRGGKRHYVFKFTDSGAAADCVRLCESLSVEGVGDIGVKMSSKSFAEAVGKKDTTTDQAPNIPNAANGQTRPERASVPIRTEQPNRLTQQHHAQSAMAFVPPNVRAAARKR
jgi:hypothetical protein